MMGVNLADLTEAAAALYNVGDKRLCAVLRAAEIEVACLRAALKPFADLAGQYDDLRSGNPNAPDGTAVTVPLGACRTALKAGG